MAARAGIAVSIVAFAALVGCASEPDRLQPARQRVMAASADADIRTHAAGSLADAQRTFALASQADERAARQHFLYMTVKNLDIADAIVARRQAAQELAMLQRQAASRERQPPADDGRGEVIEEQLAKLKEPEPPRSVALTIPNLSFASGTAELSPGAKRRLDPLVVSLRGDPSLSALVEGYTDDSGGHESNLRISLSRAQAVKDYLVEQGIAAERIQTLGHGEQYPIASNDTAEGRSQNRRIEIVVHRAEHPARQDARRR